MMLRLYSLREDTCSEGPGHRFCVWVQGCTRHCPGCFAPGTWDLEGGRLLSVDELCGLLERRCSVAPALEGITLLGGEPFLQAEALSAFATFARERGLSVFCFTGYTYEELEASGDPHIKALLAQVDVLADGPYLEEQRDFSRPWVGSRNQRFHFLTDRYDADTFLRRRNRVEVRLSRDGSLSVNGMGSFLDDFAVFPAGEADAAHAVGNASDSDASAADARGCIPDSNAAAAHAVGNASDSDASAAGVGSNASTSIFTGNSCAGQGKEVSL